MSNRGLVLREAVANIRAALPLSLTQIVLAAGLGVVAVIMPASETARIELDWQKQVDAGSAMLVVTAREGAVDAAKCEGANAVSGVAGAGGIVERTPLYLPQATRTVDALLVSPGFAFATWPAFDPEGRGASVIIPTPLAERIGVNAPHDLVFRWPGDAADAWTTVQVDAVPPARNRIDGVNDAVMFVVARAPGVQACYVSTDPRNEEAATAAVVAYFGPEYVAGEFLEDDLNVRSPAVLFGSRLGTWMSFAMAVGLLLFSVIAWQSRRADFALYRALGMTDANVRKMIAFEGALLLLAPMALSALIAAATIDRTPLGLTSALIAYGAVTAAMTLAPALASILVLRTSPIRVIKGE